MLNILWMIILIIILFIIILLLLGIRISLKYEKKGSDLKGCIRIIIFKKIKVFSKDYPQSDKKKDEEDEKEEDKHPDIKKLLKLAKPCFEDLMNYLKSMIKAMSIQKIDNHLVFGMDDFADTGKYIGMIWATFAIINSLHKNIKLSAEPSFNGSVLDGYGENNVDVYPLKLIVPTIRLLRKKEVRTLLRGVKDERKNF